MEWGLIGEVGWGHGRRRRGLCEAAMGVEEVRVEEAWDVLEAVECGRSAAGQ